MLRVIRETKPRWVIGENVEGIVNINEGMVLRQVLNDLENEGFKSQCIIIPASGIGAWHQRKRIWIMAYSDSNRHVSEIRRGNGKEKGIPVQDREKDSTSRKSIGTSDVWQTDSEYVPNTNTGFSIRENEEIQSRGNAITNGSEDVSNSECILPHGCSSTTRNSNTKQSGLECNESGNRNKVWCETERCSEQIRSSKTWWQTQSELRGVPDGLSTKLHEDRSNRIRALGNSIVPQIARQIGLSIMEAELGN
jgi:DNA (cytosine-5)-methyltransferase 1